MVELLYGRLQRQGYLHRDCVRLVNQDRNVFAGLLMALGHGDLVISGLTRSFAVTLRQTRLAIDPAPDAFPFGIHVIVGRAHTVLIADTAVHERPSAEELAYIAAKTAEVARRMGQEPRLAFLSYTNFLGGNSSPGVMMIRRAMQLLEEGGAAFEYEGEMAADVALNPDLAKLYPFSRLSGPANVLIMPGLHSANISAKLLREIGGGHVIGPILVGMSKPVQIVPMTSPASDMVTMAALAASGVA
jgi:malate dehydrogenase (oxaloacetate-decarboxylating)(NADP+)